MVAVLALTLALSGPPPASPPWTGNFGRVLTTPNVHVGVRPAFYASSDEVAFGATVQVSTLAL